jgi:pSer/pThr/pTyr-binding forkhead associated (FHA) protein
MDMTLNIIIKNSTKIVGEYFFKSDRITIGRSKTNDIVINDQTISSNHCVIKKDGSDYFIEDLDSTNGTFVNGEKIKKVRIKNNQILKIARCYVRIIFLDMDIRKAVLKVIENPLDDRKSFDLNRLTKFIGSSKSDIPVRSKNQFTIISDYAAAVSIKDNKYYLIPINPDLVKHNSNNIKNDIELNDDDEINVGITKFVFKFVE